MAVWALSTRLANRRCEPGAKSVSMSMGAWARTGPARKQRRKASDFVVLVVTGAMLLLGVQPGHVRAVATARSRAGMHPLCLVGLSSDIRSMARRYLRVDASAPHIRRALPLRMAAFSSFVKSSFSSASTVGAIE